MATDQGRRAPPLADADRRPRQFVGWLALVRRRRSPRRPVANIDELKRIERAAGATDLEDATCRDHRPAADLPDRSDRRHRGGARLGVLVARGVARASGGCRTWPRGWPSGDLTRTRGLRPATSWAGWVGAGHGRQRTCGRCWPRWPVGGRGGGVVGGAVGVVGADLGVGGGDLAPSPVSCPAAAEEVSRSVQTVAAGAEQMGASIREIASNAAEASEVAARAVTAAETTTATVAKLGESSRGDRQRGEGDHAHRRADEPAGAERHDRGGPGRGGRQGLRGGGQRGEGAGAGDGEGDRGHRPPGAGDPGRHHRGGGGDRGDQLDRRADLRPADHHRLARWRSRRPPRNEMSRSVQEAAGGTTEIAENITGVSTRGGARPRRR